MKLREEEFYEQYHQHGGTTIIPTEIFNELYDDATEEIERLNNIIKEFEDILQSDIKVCNNKFENMFDRNYRRLILEEKLEQLQELKGSDKEC